MLRFPSIVRPRCAWAFFATASGVSAGFEETEAFAQERATDRGSIPRASPNEAPSLPPRQTTVDFEWEVPTAHGVGLLATVRIAEAFVWPDPFARVDVAFWADRYAEAYSRPPKWDSSQAPFEWDGDPWPVNVVGHALLGSELYLRARSCHSGWALALGYTAVGTIAWEYGFEANGVRPSALDLWYTPMAGLLLGELRHAMLKGARSLGDSTLRTILTSVVDPFGEIERALGTPC